MKRLLFGCLVSVITVAAVQASAQDLLPAPGETPQPTEAVPTPAAPQEAVPPAPQRSPAPQMSPAPLAARPMVLYSNVCVKDPRKIHPCAVPTIVEVPDPCDPCRCVCIEVCAPPCACVNVRRHGLRGRKVEFDYGRYEIDVTSRNGRITVDYDA